MCAVCAATSPAAASSASTEVSMPRTARTSSASSVATISAATSPIPSATPQKPWFDSASGTAVTRPTATLRSARAACSTRTPESLMRSIPFEPLGLLAQHLDGADGRRGLPGDPLGEGDDRDHDRGRDEHDQDPEHETHVPASRRGEHQGHDERG